MKRGFYTIIAAQFFSSLADNALLIAAIALLIEMQAPAWMTPLLKLSFTISYVMLAPFVGAVADSFRKGRVMLVTNAVKMIGCLLMFMTLHPVLAYGVVGFGASAYSPAKYGILTELLPPEKLVAANGWIEGATVGSIIIGTLIGGALIHPDIAGLLLSIDLPGIDLGIDTPASAAITVIAGIYFIAGILNLWIVDTGARYKAQQRNPLRLIADFARANVMLWSDRLGQISLSVTTLFWGAGATLQFIVLDWAREALDMSLDKAAVLQGIVAVGIAFGAVAAARHVPLRRSLRILPVGVAMGLVVPLMTLIETTALAVPLLVIVGLLAGFFVVPMNALLQHRGHVLLSAGHSIAVQNFNENMNILLMLGLYAWLLGSDLSVNAVICMFGGFIAVTMVLVIVVHARNQKRFDSESLIGQHKPLRDPDLT
ncbi:MAG: lysophospholipid transporter LplT [Burkholderiaceae bacterium]